MNRYFGWLLIVLLISSPVRAGIASDVKSLEYMPEPEPAVMVYDYRLEPAVLCPGDIGLLTVTLKNTQDDTIERNIKLKLSESQEEIKKEVTSDWIRTSESQGPLWQHTIEREIKPGVTDLTTRTYYPMDAYIKDAHIRENRNFKVYNRFRNAGLVGPARKVDLVFKLKAPLVRGIYMLEFIADVENTNGKSSKGVRYFIPVIVDDGVTLMPVETTADEIRLEVINEGSADLNSLYVAASPAGIVEPARIYVGRIKSGESNIVAFRVKNGTEGNNVSFKTIFRNGINRHESGTVTVRLPYSNPQREEADVRTANLIGDETPAPDTQKLHSSSPYALIIITVLIIAACLAYKYRGRGGES